MTTKWSFFVCALVLLVAPVTEAATQQFYTAVVDAGVDQDADVWHGFTLSSSTTSSPAPGFSIGFDFDDTNLRVHPGAQDTIDGRDNDQDGVVDGSHGATGINALPDVVLAEGQSFSADWIITGINSSLIGVFLQAAAGGATYSESLTGTLVVTATVGWTAQVGDAGQTYLFRINAPNIDAFTVTVGDAGDFDANGRVDAADYVLWRKSNGTQTGYVTWRENFGQPGASGIDLAGGPPFPSPVPEPAGFVLALVAVIMGLAVKRR